LACIDARHAKAVLKMLINKSDRNDAAGIGRIKQTGWFKEVSVKDLDSHSVRALLASLALLVKIKRDLENQIRGLKNLGLVIGRAKFNVFAARAEELIEDRPELIAAVGPLTLILAEMLILAEIMSIAGSANRPRRAPRPSPLNRELNSRRTLVF
jgi:transposase